MYARFLAAGCRNLFVFFLSLPCLSGSVVAYAEDSIPSLVDAASVSDSTTQDAQSLQEPDYLLDEEDRATATASEEAESPAPIASEPSTEIPPAEALLQLKPLSGATARFTDLLIPPAEIAQDAAAKEQESEELTAYNVPIVLDPSVQGHIRFFNVAIRSRFEQWLIRLSHYRPLVDSIFSEFQLPSDLIYLSLVESGFNPHAYSRARAAGPWQFMKGTAKVYGLRVDSYVDERRDPVKSTVAAARYLRDLYDLFGTWPLAMAAYNAGEGKVMRALHTAQAESFSDIAKTRLIRRETKEYVPRFMAATIIAKNPDRYGFPQNEIRPHEFDEVIVRRPIHFKAIANLTGISYLQLKVLNPELRRDATPPDDAEYHLKVPVGTKEKVEQLLDRAPTHKFTPLPIPVKGRQFKTEPESGQWYRVRVGDSLEKIAKRFKISVKALKTHNNLTGPTIKAGSRLVIAH
ncbi:MAG: putative Lytic murein transglycosylase [Nitrospira sp.]|jgi:membrane-bound lytic murein transglycosylase D|nr:putative Lytic murein transglycosylase [Nitrospira sp.]